MASSTQDSGNEDTPAQLSSLEKAIRHIKFIDRFENRELVYTALYHVKANKNQHPHSNIANGTLERDHKNPTNSNGSAAAAHFQGRLEFLGKSVIRSATALIFYSLFQSGMDPWTATGLNMGLDWLTAIKSKTEIDKYKEHMERGVALVCSKSMIGRYAKALGLEKCLEEIVGELGQMHAGEKQQMLAKYFSSVMGALYLDKMNLVVIMDVLKVPMVANKFAMDLQAQEEAKVEGEHTHSDDLANMSHARLPSGNDASPFRQSPNDLRDKIYEIHDPQIPAENTMNHDESDNPPLAPPTKKSKFNTGEKQANTDISRTNDKVESTYQHQGPGEGKPATSSKPALFVFCAKNGIPPPKLQDKHISGPPHAPIFRTVLTINGHRVSEACGSSKKDAHTAVCAIALVKSEAERMAWKNPPSAENPE